MGQITWVGDGADAPAGPRTVLDRIADQNTLSWRVDNELRVLEEMPLGAELVSRLAALSGGALGCSGAVRVTTLWGKVIAWAQAEQMIATTEAISSLDLDVTSDHLKAPLVVGQELACASHTSLQSAMTHVTLTERVGETMPKSWIALSKGEWSLAHVRSLAQATEWCTPRVSQAVEAEIVPVAIARGWTPPQVKKHAVKLLLSLDPEGAADRAARAKKQSDVTFTPLPDETATVTGFGDAFTVRRIFDTINNRAAALGRDGDERNVGQRRLAALAEAVLGRGDSTRPAAQALVMIPAGTLLGDAEPGELAGYGPVAAASARQFGTDAIWRKLIMDPGTGKALDLGMSAYRPSAQLIRYVRARDWTCVFPGCSQPATECDCDHRVDHADGGPTEPRNLHLLCRLHHNFKTCRIWHARVTEDGNTEWISPLGHVYASRSHLAEHDLLDPPDPGPPDPGPPDAGSAADQGPPGLRAGDLHAAAFDDADLPWPDEPPPIGPDELEEYLDAVDELERDFWFRANAGYDEFRARRLIA